MYCRSESITMQRREPGTEARHSSQGNSSAYQNRKLCRSIAKIDKIERYDSVLFNLLGSTLLSINDIGRQPGFLEMLPALSTGPAMYLVFFDLSKELNRSYKIPFNRGTMPCTL